MEFFCYVIIRVIISIMNVINTLYASIDFMLTMCWCVCVYYLLMLVNIYNRFCSILFWNVLSKVWGLSGNNIGLLRGIWMVFVKFSLIFENYIKTLNFYLKVEITISLVLKVLLEDI